VCTDISTRTTADGSAMAYFSVVSNERRYDQNTGTWSNGSSLFIKVKCFRKLAEGVAASLHKGDPVVVTGRAYTTKYEVDGQNRSDLEVEATGIGPDLMLCRAVVQRDQPAEAIAA
jgi:single-strand DNA-binding protein